MGGCRFGVKDGLRHWVGEKGRGGAETWWECATVRPEFVDVPSPESSERYPLRREPLSSNEAVPIVSFHYKEIREGRESLLRMRSPIIISWSLMVQKSCNWSLMMEHEDTPRAQIHHEKPTIRINGTCPKPKCDFPRVKIKIQADFQQGSRAMSRYFQVYRTARPLTLQAAVNRLRSGRVILIMLVFCKWWCLWCFWSGVLVDVDEILLNPEEIRKGILALGEMLNILNHQL